MKHPAVLDVCVVGVDDERAGEVPKAFIVCRPGQSPSERDICSWIEERVSPFKRLRFVEFVESIPKSPSGKILRRLLRDRRHLSAKL